MEKKKINQWKKTVCPAMDPSVYWNLALQLNPELGITTHQEKDRLTIMLGQQGKKYWISILHKIEKLIPDGIKT